MLFGKEEFISKTYTVQEIRTLPLQEINRIYHHIVEGTRESNPSVHDLQSTTRLAESWMLQIMDTRMGFPCPFHNVVIDYFSPTPFIFNK